jgi:uncharacterized protein
MTPYLAPVMGLLAGAAVGFCVRRARLCTFGAIEDALGGGDYRRIKAFGLALAVALLGTQALILAGALSPTQSMFMPSRLAVLSIAAGSFMFGLGMAYVGTCAFGSIVRLGGGDLRAFVVILTFAAAAYAMLRGVLAGVRIDVIEPLAVAMPGGHPGGFVEIAEGLSGLDLRLIATVLAAGLLLWPVATDKRLLKARRMLTAGVVLGLGVVAGWLATGVFVDAFATTRVQSLTFVAPVARGVFSVVLGGSDWFDFGVMSVVGVLMGAFVSAWVSDEFRWEAFDDPREMGRHLAGALLMGVGGVLAGGCTIGQGLSAGSMLAVSWPLAVLGMGLGARVGIAILVEGSARYWLRELVARRWPLGPR